MAQNFTDDEFLCLHSALSLPYWILPSLQFALEMGLAASAFHSVLPSEVPPPLVHLPTWLSDSESSSPTPAQCPASDPACYHVVPSMHPLLLIPLEFIFIFSTELTQRSLARAKDL